MNPDLLKGILRCPKTGDILERTATGLKSPSGANYPIVRGVPVFTDEGNGVAVHPDSHLSNPIASDALAMMVNTQGWILNLSAGGSESRLPNVVELEYSIFRNTCVVGDAHQLPFASESFEGCLCMNAFEHYHSPDVVAREVLRVLKPGGWFIMHTAALQPLHEAPHHYFNATSFGVALWLKDFQDLKITVSPNFHPIFALSWLVSEIERGMAKHPSPEVLKLIHSATVSDLAAFWRDPVSRTGPLWDAFQQIDDQTRHICAAGWQAIGRKPPSDAKDPGVP
jgi:SAM-dependent methyltransferase